MFKEHHVRESIGNTGEDFEERGLATQKCSFLNLGDKDEDPVGASGMGRESKPRGQLSAITTTIYTDATSTWTTYEGRSPE